MATKYSIILLSDPFLIILPWFMNKDDKVTMMTAIIIVMKTELEMVTKFPKRKQGRGNKQQTSKRLSTLWRKLGRKFPV